MTAVQDRTARRSSVLARGGATLAAAGLIAAGLGLGAAPASAAESTVENVSFSWQVNAESGAGAWAGGCNFLSAGKAGNVGSSGTWTEELGEYKTSDGNVSITKPNAAGEQVAPTWDTKCLNAQGVAVTPFGANTSTGNQVNFTAGTGTVDADANNAEISWDGSFTFVFYGGMTYWSVSDVELQVTNGEGTLTGTASGYGASMEDTGSWVPLADQRIELATFSGADLSATGAIITTDYAGVEVSASGTPQSRTGANWGAFPQSLVDFNQLTGQASYWYSSGGAADARKPALPFSVAYTLPEVEVPGTPEGNVDVVIPEVEVEPPVDPTGSFSWAWADPKGADLGTAVQTGDTFVANGSISEVAVTDTRAGGTEAYGWTVSGQSTDFSNGTDTISATNLGWAPKLLAGNEANVTTGAAVTGLNTAQQLATSNAAASATLGADLTLTVPTTTQQGAYSATLTISAIS